MKPSSKQIQEARAKYLASLSPAEKIAEATNLIQYARNAQRAYLRKQRPEATEREIDLLLAERWLDKEPLERLKQRERELK